MRKLTFVLFLLLNMSLSHAQIRLGVGTVIAGAQFATAGYAGDSALATSAQFNKPLGIAVDSKGDVYISDSGNHRIRMIEASSGIIYTIAGTGTAGFNGDGLLGCLFCQKCRV